MNTNKIKIEPGTSKLSNVIRFEEGRLPSLVSRSLKLGSKPKIFKPNLVERKKKTESQPDVQENSRGRGRNDRNRRGGDRGGRGSSRGGRGNQFIQSHGVFSEGMSEGQKKVSLYSDRSHNVSDSDAAKMMDKPVLQKNTDYKIDKEHEEKVMLQLYDDHIDQDESITNEIYPINLPTLPNLKSNVIIKQKIIKKIKEDPDEPEVISNDNPDIQQVASYNDEVKIETKVENYLFNSQDKLLLFQFPDCLPGIGPVIEPDKSQKNTTETDISADKNEERNKCTLNDINEGKIGKIVLYKSGKINFIIGNSVFDIDEGFNPGFLQDVVSVSANTNTKMGDMINLGSIEDSVVVTPQFDNLLKK